MKSAPAFVYSLSVLPSSRAISSSSESSGSEFGVSALSLIVGITGRCAGGGGGGGGGGALGGSGRGGGALFGVDGVNIGGAGRWASWATAGALAPSSFSCFGVMTRGVLDKNDGIPGGRGGGAGLAGGALKPIGARGGAGLIGGGAEGAKDGEGAAGLTAGAVGLLDAELFWAKRSGGRLTGPGGLRPGAEGLASGVGSSGAGVGGAGQLAAAPVGAFRFVA